MGKEKNTIEIFYADDRSSDRLFFELMLDEIGFTSHLKMAKDGKEAMELLNDSNNYKPDFIFLDLKMPYKDGFECLQEIRENKRFKLTPVIIFSTSTDEKDIRQTYRNHANLFVEKPYDFKSQVRIMRKVFSLDWDEYFPAPPEKKFLFKL